MHIIMINSEPIVTQTKPSIEKQQTRNIDNVLVIGRHESLLRTFEHYPNRQFCLYRSLVQAIPARLPELVILELPKIDKHCTAKYRAFEKLVMNYDRTQVNVVISLQMPTHTRKVPDSLLEKGSLKATRHCYCRYINASCHTKLTLLAGGPIADKIVNRLSLIHI